MTRFKRFLLALCLLSACKPSEPEPKPSSTAVSGALAKPAQTAQPKLVWALPKLEPQGPQAELIRYGQQIISQTPQLLGPDQPDKQMRYAGNRLSCKNCHLDAGRQANAMGYVGITARFPQFRPRENSQQSLADRINGCFSRSLNGRDLPQNSREMQAILAYMNWLSQDYPKGSKVQGQGVPEIELPNRAADPVRGQKIFSSRCTACHQANGQGLRANPNQPSAGYLYPPLWGPDSFNTGAGMHRLIISARYIRANMPLGQADLTPEQAFDVSAYINSQPRPVMTGLDKDFPDRKKKPVDTPFGPWDDGFSATQHKYGPFGPMLAARGQKNAGGN